MNQGELVHKLDTFFNVQAYDERGFWSGVITDNEYSIYARFAREEFLDGPWNGLMLDNTEEIDRVYLVVFPAPTVLDIILALEVERGARGALIFAMHPVDFEEKGRGFLGIGEAQLEELREHSISYYACHAPLDCHPEISTVIAFAKALRLREAQPFSPHFGSTEGIHGRVPDTTFYNFAEFLADVTDLPYIRYNQIRFNARPVEHIALIPGGGDHVRHLEQARDLGCDTYVTGSWWPVGEYAYAVQQRAALRELVPGLPMNLLGTSHYASEMPVLRDQMLGWFRSAGIEARFIRQIDPWR